MMKLKLGFDSKNINEDSTKILYFPSNFERHLLCTEQNTQRKILKNPFFTVNIEEKSQTTTINKKTLVQLMVEGSKKFCLGSMHGLKYMRDPSLGLWERIFWSIVFLTSIFLCSLNIYTLWQTWITSPFTLVNDDAFTPVYDIPFPAVIICPQNAVKKSKFDITKSQDKKLLFMASLLCEKMLPKQYSLDEKLSPEDETDILNFALGSTPSCSEMIKSCSFMDFTGNSSDCCNNFFERVFTDKGICFGFNMLTDLSPDKREKILNNKSGVFLWDPHSGYESNYMESDGYLPYPRRVLSGGNINTLDIELTMNASEIQTVCDGFDFGFTIFIDSPIETSVTKTFTKLPTGKETVISIVPKMVTTRKDMKSMRPEVRKCYFYAEKKLSDFKYYTRFNCRTECEMKLIQRECKCIPFYYKQFVENMSMCNTLKEYQCLLSTRRALYVAEMKSYYAAKSSEIKLKKNNVSNFQNKIVKICGCLLSCTYISYGMEVFSVEHDNRMLLKINDEKNNIENITTKISIRFKESTFFGYHREKNFDDINFLSSCGGVLGLFLGFSIVTMVELIYFVCVRPLIFWIKQEKFNRKLN